MVLSNRLFVRAGNGSEYGAHHADHDARDKRAAEAVDDDACAK